MLQAVVFRLILLSAAGWFARFRERSKANGVAQLRALGERGAAPSAVIVIRHEPIRLHPAKASRNPRAPPLIRRCSLFKAVTTTVFFADRI